MGKLGSGRGERLDVMGGWGDGGADKLMEVIGKWGVNIGGWENVNLDR